jgi:hypothetical protein
MDSRSGESFSLAGEPVGQLGRLGHFYDLFQRAQSEENWAAFRFTTE